MSTAKVISVSTLTFAFLLMRSFAYADINSSVHVTTSGNGQSSVNVQSTSQSSSTTSTTNNSRTHVTTVINGKTEEYDSDSGDVSVEVNNGKSSVTMGNSQAKQSNSSPTPTTEDTSDEEGERTDNATIATSLNSNDFSVVEQKALKDMEPVEEEIHKSLLSTLSSFLGSLFHL